MADDPKLIEAVARALDPTAWIPADATTEQVKFCRRSHRRNAAKRKAYRLLAAINASGTHWVAPVEATEDMGNLGTDWVPSMPPEAWMAAWSAMRTAYLAKTETKP